jgi:lipid-binding SYLF domain-containing protein
MNLKLVVPALALAACSHAEVQPAARSSSDSSEKAELNERFVDATELLKDLRQRVAEPVLKRARCAAVVPGLLSGGVIVGGRHGRGFATCRVEDGWSSPAPIAISGASVGPQLGVQSVDLVMLVMSDLGMKKLLSAKLTLGADMSVAAGPVGKGREVDTDAALKTEAVSYTRSRGLFAGVELDGAVVEQDVSATASLYGRAATFQQLLSGGLPIPPEARSFVAAVSDTF